MGMTAFRKVALVTWGCAALASCTTLGQLGVPGANKDEASTAEAPSPAHTVASDEEEDPLKDQPELTESQEASKEALIEAIQSLGWQVDVRDGSFGEVRDSSRAADALNRCLEHSRALLDEGVSGELLMKSDLRLADRVHVRDHNPEIGGYYVRLGDLPEFCKEGTTVVIAAVVYEEMRYAINGQETLLEREFEREYSLAGYESYGRRCKRGIDDARANYGAQDDLILDLPKLDPMTLTELEAFCDAYVAKVAEIKQEVTDRRQAALEAELAPYRTALQGDKLRIFLDREMQDKRIRTRGGRVIDSPREFANAPLWCETLGDAHGRARWTVRCFQFNGNRLADLRERSGYGSSPPSNAYR
jgi:hypothetical protein